MKRTLRTILGVGVAASLLALTACSTGSSSADGGSGSDSDVKVAIVLKTLSSEFWQNMKNGAEARAKELGVTLDVSAANSEDDVEGQVSLVQNAVSKGYQAVGVAPISAVNLNNAIADATRDGVYVVNIDESVDVKALNELGGAVQAFVTTDNVEVGKTAGDFIATKVTDGEVAIIEGKAGALSGADRVKGAKGAVEAAGLTVVESQPADWDRTKAYSLAQNYLSKYPDLKAIYAANDTMAMGAQEAVAASGRDVVVVGTDGNSDAVESVKAGALAATVKQDSAAVGATAVDQLVDLAKNKPEITVDAEVAQERVPAILVTKDS